MNAFLPERVRFGAHVIALRLRLRFMLRSRSLPELLRALTPSAPARDKAPLSAVEEALCAAEGLLERLRLAPDTCLYRSLARYAVLRSAGHPVRFFMGVQPDKEDITGHAWLELDGEPYGETVDPALVVTYAYPDRTEANRSGS